MSEPRPMTATDFVRLLAIEAKKSEQPVLAVDFEPYKNGVRIAFRFKYSAP